MKAKTAHRTDLVEKAKRAAAETETWADFSNYLFNPDDGLLTSEFKVGRERKAFKKTGEYKTIMNLVGDVMQRTGIVEGATPRKSGKFVVRLPKTLHEALEREAIEEGTSLNQLVVYKLAAQLKPTTLKAKHRQLAAH